MSAAMSGYEWPSGVENPVGVMLARALQERGAEGAWLARMDTGEIEVVTRAGWPQPLVFQGDDAPPPPNSAMLVGPMNTPWLLWCQARGMVSSAIAPVVQGGLRVGTVGVFSSDASADQSWDLGRLELLASWAAETVALDNRIERLRRGTKDVMTMLRSLALRRSLSGRYRYRSLAYTLGNVLEGSYCRVAVLSKVELRIQASGGRRVPSGPDARRWLLSDLPGLRELTARGRAIVLSFDANLGDREAYRPLFSPTTRTAVLVPFQDGDHRPGLLLIGEERSAARQPQGADQVQSLEYVGHRVGEILETARLMRRARAVERLREAQRIQRAERQRLARGMHDEVGHAFSAMLVGVRAALRDGPDVRTLQALESAAQSGLDAARALAYGLRHGSPTIEPLRAARLYSESVLEQAGCKLSWIDEGATAGLPSASTGELAQVIKESVTNTVRHGRASSVKVGMVQGADGLTVRISDDGVGFDPELVKLDAGGAGLGLMGSRERIARLRGTLKVASRPGQGTEITVNVPVKTVGIAHVPSA